MDVKGKKRRGELEELASNHQHRQPFKLPSFLFSTRVRGQDDSSGSRPYIVSHRGLYGSSGGEGGSEGGEGPSSLLSSVEKGETSSLQVFRELFLRSESFGNELPTCGLPRS